HYLINKHLGSKWRNAALHWLNEIKPDIVVSNFLWTYPFLAKWKTNQRLFLDTHNYDLEWFGNLARNTRNPLKKIVCRNSSETIVRILRELPVDTPLIH